MDWRIAAGLVLTGLVLWVLRQCGKALDTYERHRAMREEDER